MSVFGVFLVNTFPAFSRIRIEYGELLRISPHSVWIPKMREKCGPEELRIRTLFTRCWLSYDISNISSYFLRVLIHLWKTKGVKSTKKCHKALQIATILVWKITCGHFLSYLWFYLKIHLWGRELVVKNYQNKPTVIIRIIQLSNEIS